MSLGWILFGYAVGSVPFGYIFAYRLGGFDVRRRGSGNVGAANVWRTTHRRSAGVLVAILDIVKGAGAVLCAARLGADVSIETATGVAAIVGHVYPIWLRFQGGKGVATACGVFGVLAPSATALAVAGFVATVTWTRFVSLGSVVAMGLLVPLAYATRAPEPVVAGAAVASALVLFRHRTNVVRLMAGTERRLAKGD